MEPRISLITLGVRDLKKSRAFYDALGWHMASSDEEAENIVAYNMSNGMALGLFGHDALAHDANVSPDGSGFRGVSIAYNVDAKDDVARILSEAEAAGGKIMKPAEDVFWGGHSGYFADPDGHMWEVAYNPYAPLGPNGEFQWNGYDEKEKTT